MPKVILLRKNPSKNSYNFLFCFVDKIDDYFWKGFWIWILFMSHEQKKICKTVLLTNIDIYWSGAHNLLPECLTQKFDRLLKIIKVFDYPSNCRWYFWEVPMMEYFGAVMRKPGGSRLYMTTRLFRARTCLIHLTMTVPLSKLYGT